MNGLTILTRPIGPLETGRYWLKNLARFAKNVLTGGAGLGDFDRLKYGGHFAVTRSLVAGLNKTGATFNYNPFSIKNIKTGVLVLSDVAALRQAIGWKRHGRITKLLAGPNLMEIPIEHGGILAAPELDWYLVPSQEAADVYARFVPSLKSKLRVWYAGVDEEFWRPTDLKPKGRQVAVYWKNASDKFSILVEEKLKEFGYSPVRIKYGKYSRNHYKSVLAQSVFAVFLSITESQSLALAEAWAMDVPTVVWNPKVEHYYLRGIITSAAPYLTGQTGIEWKELGELEKVLGTFQQTLQNFKPRQWVLEHMTDRHAAGEILALLAVDKSDYGK